MKRYGNKERLKDMAKLQADGVGMRNKNFEKTYNQLLDLFDSFQDNDICGFFGGSGGLGLRARFASSTNLLLLSRFFAVSHTLLVSCISKFILHLWRNSHATQLNFWIVESIEFREFVLFLCDTIEFRGSLNTFHY